MSAEWRPEHFVRRSYSAVGRDLDDAKRIEVTVKVDNRVVIQAQAREPGLLAIISRPAEQGIDVEMVEVDRVQFTDYRLPNGEKVPIEPWIMEALGIKSAG